MSSFSLRSWIPAVYSVILIGITSFPIATPTAATVQYSGLLVATMLAAWWCIPLWRPVAASGLAVTGGWLWVVFSSSSSERFYRIAVLAIALFILLQWLTIVVNTPIRLKRTIGLGQWIHGVALVILVVWSIAVWSAPAVLPMMAIPTVLEVTAAAIAGVIWAIAGLVQWRGFGNGLLLGIVGALASTVLAWLPGADGIRFIVLIAITLFIVSGLPLGQPLQRADDVQ